MPFNDEFVSSKLAELYQVEIGEFIISHESVARVREILELCGDSETELRAKRNSIVKLISKQHLQTNNLVQIRGHMKYITGITTVIDMALADLDDMTM